MKRGKRGISTVIVTVILVGLVLVAVGVVAFVIKNLISQQTKGIGLGKFTINLEIQKATISGSNIIVDVNRKAGEGTVLGGTFVVSNGTDKETIKQDFSINQLETKSFTITPSKININTVTQVSIAPSFLSDSGEKTAGDVITSTYTFSTGVQQGGQQGASCNPACSGSTPYCVNGVCQAQSGQGCTPTCSGSTPNCVNNQCIACIANADCSSFGTGYTCVNSVCVPPACVPETNQQACQRLQIECGSATNNCGGAVASCGTCQVQGQFCVAGKCKVLTPINFGKVQDIWPPNSNLAFGSSNLNAVPQLDFTFKYISFPGNANEVGCRLIARFVSSTDVPLYGKGIVEFNSQTLIAAQNDYKIWNSQSECTASLGF